MRGTTTSNWSNCIILRGYERYKEPLILSPLQAWSPLQRMVWRGSWCPALLVRAGDLANKTQSKKKKANSYSNKFIYG